MDEKQQQLMSIVIRNMHRLNENCNLALATIAEVLLIIRDTDNIDTLKSRVVKSIAGFRANYEDCTELSDEVSNLGLGL